MEDGPDGGSVFRAVLWSQPPADDAAAPPEPAVGRTRRTPSWVAAGLLALSLTPGCRAPTPAPVVEIGPLELADAAFDRGDYEAAIAAYQEHLDRGPSPAGDRAVFRLALMHVLPGSPVRDPRRGRELLWELVERFPESPFRAVAEYLLGLQREVEVLRRQIDEIKRIDLDPGSSEP